MEDIGFESVFSGASCTTSGGHGAVRGTGYGGFLIDDDLSGDEADTICGHYDHLIRKFPFERYEAFPSMIELLR